MNSVFVMIYAKYRLINGGLQYMYLEEYLKNRNLFFF